MEPINLNRLVHFSAVAETSSFTKAAERLGITKAVISQQVRRLEADLKTSLLIRTTRRVELTEAGRLLHARCLTIFSEAEDAINEIAEMNAAPAGTLRIAAPNDYGAVVVAPVVAVFSKTYPACAVELLLSDSKSDLVGEQIDVSIRVGWLTDSSSQTRRIGSFQQLLVAAPQVASAIHPKEPADVGNAPFIANASLKDPLTWRFSCGDLERRTVHMRQDIMTNSTPAALAAALAGGGLSVLPDYLVKNHIASGRLVHVLASWALPGGGVFAVYPAARFRPAKVTAFVELLSGRVHTVSQIHRSDYFE